MAFKEPTSLKSLLAKQKAKELNYQTTTASKNFRVKPSSIGIPCLRYLLYECMRVTPDFSKSLELLWYGEAGSAYHTFLQKDLKKALAAEGHKFIEYKTIKEGRVPKSRYGDGLNPEFLIRSKKLQVKRGYIDGVLIIDNELWILEIKTASPNSMKALRKPKDEHLAQGHFCLNLFNMNLRMGYYSHIRELKGWGPAKGVIFFYVDRNSPAIQKEFRVLLDKDVMKQLVNKVQFLQKASVSKKLPPKSQHFCYNCEFRKKCGKNQLS